MKRRSRWPAAGLLAYLLCGCGTLLAGVAGDRLQQFLDGTRTLSADFIQHQQGEMRAGTGEASGHLLISRPGRFRWDYLTPYRQLIIADGERLWIYDSDLEQVTVKAQAEALGSSPAQLLSGTLDLQGFAVVETGERDGVAWIEIKPQGDDNEFSEVHLGFSPEGLHAMRMRDNLGNDTLIYFSNLANNIAIEPGKFSFTPPAGVDVLGQ